jgi:hypothetical protein
MNGPGSSPSSADKHAASGPVRSPDYRARERRVYRFAVGGVHIALAVMLSLGVVRYFHLIAPRYGHRFVYVAFFLAGTALWIGVRGVLILFGRAGEAR